MINEIKKSIIKNLTLESFDSKKDEIFLTKFSHAQDFPYSKVLFLVTNKKQILGIIKVIRDKKYNVVLSNEFGSQKNSNDHSSKVKTPETYFTDTLENGYDIYMEEFVGNGPIGKRDAKEYLDKIYLYQDSVIKKEDLSISSVADIFATKEIELNNKIYSKLIKKLRGLGGFASKAENHGDLTYMNVCDVKGTTYFIDWTNYGERKIWGIDFVHYFIRSFGIKNEEEFERRLSKYREESGLLADIDYFKKIYLVDRLYDLLEKNNRYLYVEVCDEIK